MDDEDRESLKKTRDLIKVETLGMTSEQEEAWLLGKVDKLFKLVGKRCLDMKPYFDRLEELKELDRDGLVHGQHLYARRWQKAG